ncbi:hypothetical protein ABTA52_19930, partial [Acinetobacter baumannii]
HSALASDATVVASVRDYSPEKVAEEIGMKEGAAKIRNVARALVAAGSRALVVGGGIETRTQDARSRQIAVTLLNSALGAEGAT